MQGLVTLTVAAQSAGERLDRFLAAHTPSRAQAQRQIEAGAVWVDGRPGRAAERLRAGQHVAWSPVARPPSALVAEDIPLVVLHEDEHVVVIDKPAGLVVHPAAGHATGTLVHALLGRAHGGEAMRPGIVHRLDKGTSGVLVVAKSDLAFARLGAQFREHTVLRRYLAIVVGAPAASSGEMRTLYGRHPTQRKKFSSRVRAGKPAATLWRVIERLAGGAAALVEARLETGRTHQVRVHFADAGHPLLGDPIYARAPRDQRLRAIAAELARPALHAASLAFLHPATGERMAFEAEPPADFLRALESLRRLV